MPSLTPDLLIIFDYSNFLNEDKRDSPKYQVSVILNLYGMNYRIYNKNVEKHAQRTEMENLPREFIEIIESFNELIEDGDVLDIGCGTGRDLSYMHSRYNLKRGIGIDLAENMIEWAKENNSGGGLHYATADGKQLPFKQNTFSGVWCPATIFLLKYNEIPIVLKEIHRILEDDGIALVGFKTKDSKTNRNGYVERKRWGEKIRYYYFSDESAKNLCTECQFDIVNTASNMFNETRFFSAFITPR